MKSKNKNVFKQLGFSDKESANLEARSRLLILLEQEIKKLGLTQAQAANILGVKPPRISEIVNGRIEKFSIDLLITYLARLGKTLEFKLKDAA